MPNLKDLIVPLMTLIIFLPAFQMHMLDIGSRFRKHRIHRQTTPPPLETAHTSPTATQTQHRSIHRACATVAQVGIKFFSVHGCTNKMVKRCECIGVNHVHCNSVCKRMGDYLVHKVRLV